MCIRDRQHTVCFSVNTNGTLKWDPCTIKYADAVGTDAFSCLCDLWFISVSTWSMASEFAIFCNRTSHSFGICFCCFDGNDFRKVIFDCPKEQNHLRVLIFGFLISKLGYCGRFPYQTIGQDLLKYCKFTNSFSLKFTPYAEVWNKTVPTVLRLHAYCSTGSISVSV